MNSPENSNIKVNNVVCHRKEVLRYRSADVARCWAKYGLILLSSSKDRLLESEEHPQEDYPGLFALVFCHRKGGNLHQTLIIHSNLFFVNLFVPL